MYHSSRYSCIPLSDAVDVKATAIGYYHYSCVEHSNSGKESFDSILATESIFFIRFGNLINLPLVPDIQIVT